MIDPAQSVQQALARPMPHADAATARLAAERMAGLSAELSRVRNVLAGAMGREAGWSGAAELAFQDSMLAELNRFAAAFQRFEGHAAALTGYARELDLLGPRLLAARARLVDGSTAGVADGSTTGVADLERYWQEWDAARRRCSAGLAVGTESHRHGWSGLVSGVSRTVRHETASLAGLSRVLSDVGQALTVAGLTLALVCPPAAGAVWAAVAVVAVCQLAVDVARRERGEHVGMAGLGWDALGALPGGRLMAGFHSAVEASAAIERLAPELRSSRLVPGGGLMAHEGTATHRGHTLLKHVGQTPRQLAKRFKTEPYVKWSSSFTDRATAEAAVAKAIQDNPQAITAWLASSLPSLRIHTDVGIVVGRSVAKNGTIISTSKVRVALRKENTVLGYYIKTAHPTP
jgi:hypothetical protein